MQVYGRASERQRLAKLRNDAASAIAGRDEGVLERRVQEVAELVMTILPPGAIPSDPGGGPDGGGPTGPPIPGAPFGKGWPTT